MHTLRILFVLTFATLAGCTSMQTCECCSSGTAVSDSAADVEPLGVGDTAPDVTLRQTDGTEVATADVFAKKPTALVVYRGGWCPYCTTQMRDLVEVQDKLQELGYQIIAVSPDRPQELAKSIADEKLSYTLLSDNDIELAKAMGLAFRVDDATYSKLMGHGIDLEESSGRDHRVLPVPAVYLIDRDGTIRYAYWDVDYKTRLSGDALLTAARRHAIN